MKNEPYQSGPRASLPIRLLAAALIVLVLCWAMDAEPEPAAYRTPAARGEAA